MKLFLTTQIRNPFFRGVWVMLTVVLAQTILGNGEINHLIKGNVKADRLRRIAEVLNNLEHGEGKDRIRPDWKAEIDYVLKGKGEPIPTAVICDVFVEDLKKDKKYAFELKAPLPNSDQSKVSKEKIFKLLAMEPRIVDEAFYALPYNPYGKRENYAWSFPARWFDMKNDSVVLIGDEFWDKLGGKGAYQNFIQEINKLGKEYRYRIYREYLGIEPPESFDKDIL